MIQVYEFGRYSINNRISESFIDRVQNAYGINNILIEILDKVGDEYD